MARARKEAMDGARAFDKKDGSTSDRSCSETFTVPNIVNRLTMFIIPGKE
jgi:hypothetical protein